ncbi:MAG TPA: Lrp/AsnC family transcriptional regulator [Methanoregulaceae archaeon]|jgi:DNA-binding Lrp family transcriptional regulator|nr:Lrp/AsnC family transcriptional regulator [Methanolinea sp.]MCC7566755.1 Lrp/AsnC family transcriptional regulator [Methanoregulaceae archaeon]MDD3091534.1 Lrp/AsnC family transcriptional regulator [Methanoregulaceae archaeon]MDD5048009.1 Lrp/AsnC family transcriptional regulator [Methanoregulaceae archaeon]MDD5685478.1 Lrp/AsnC family transcriptional regulator [Methanoregulaceae archaeon]
MDEKDLLILQILEDNSRLSRDEMALMAELEPDEIETRIAALEEGGVIRNYTAVIDWDKAGNGEVAAIIDLKVNPERDYGYDRIADRLSRFRQVKSLRLVTGVYDLQLMVTGRNMQEIARFVSEYIAPMDRIRETATHIIMRTYKEYGHSFMDRETKERIPYSL